ncbi:MAG: beta-phosphoglucomutase [Bacteroidales bacterium]|nr:beta-phosphoglucomutase [Bacteroidales bacterium]
MILKACIFDLDGVIVDTAKYHYLAWKKLAEQLEIPFTETDNERLKGVSRMDSLEIILELGHKKLNEDLKKKYAAQKNTWYTDHIKRMTPDEILPGSLEFIHELRNAGIRVAIGSASKNTPLILERVGIKGLFDAVADGNSVEKAKPDPEVFLKAAELIGVDPANCVVFEDAAAGIQAALNAGMKCIGVGATEVLGKAHFVIPGLREMNLEKLEILEREILL